jgi:hypothetical protein
LIRARGNTGASTYHGLQTSYKGELGFDDRQCTFSHTMTTYRDFRLPDPVNRDGPESIDINRGSAAIPTLTSHVWTTHLTGTSERSQADVAEKFSAMDTLRKLSHYFRTTYDDYLLLLWQFHYGSKLQCQFAGW